MPSNIFAYFVLGDKFYTEWWTEEYDNSVKDLDWILDEAYSFDSPRGFKPGQSFQRYWYVLHSSAICCKMTEVKKKSFGKNFTFL